MLISIVAGTAVSATVGSLSLRLGGVISSHAIATVWRTWWLGDATGALIVVPLAIAWYRPRVRDWRIGRPREAVLLLATVVALSELVMTSSRPLTYVLFRFSSGRRSVSERAAARLRSRSARASRSGTPPTT